MEYTSSGAGLKGSYAIGIIDIGMTNKKVAVYDETLKQIDAHYRNFPPKMVNGIETHDLEAMETWFLEELGGFAKIYPIKAIAVTTHGATFVCVGRDGKPSVPCVYYTYEPGDAFHDRFYAAFGSPVDLQAKTGTPALKALINTAKGIFFVKEQFPEQFKNTAHLLTYPQYWAFRLTGKTGVEGTYMGCHSYLWDQTAGKLSPVAEALGAVPLMPGELKNSWDVMGTLTGEASQKTGLDRDVIVTMGIHDSNSSLLPHFAKKGETGFVLNSTGTWCVIMNPVKKFGFAKDELGKVVFFNISAFRTPVKTAIFVGGQEFEMWSKILMDLHRRKDIPSYNEELYRSMLRERRAFLLPELIPGSGQFPHSKPRVAEGDVEYHYADILKSVSGGGDKIPPCFRDYEKGIALLRISLVMQTLTGLSRTGLVPGAEVYIEGGFRRDKAYNILLSSALSGNRLFLTDITEATAYGAAMTAKMALTGKTLGDLARDFEIDYQEVAKSDMPGLEAYRGAWLKYTE